MKGDRSKNMKNYSYSKKMFVRIIATIVIMLVLIPKEVYGMHIMEGFLPPVWSFVWGVASLPFVIIGLISIQRKTKTNPRIKLLLGMVGAFAFVLSAVKIPSVNGSSSHPTGVGLGTILFGPASMSVLGLIVLMFQAILLAHGGLTTLGANTFSMAIAGPFVAFLVYKIVIKMRGKSWLAVFLASSLGNLFTYIVTAIQLGIAHPDPNGGVLLSIEKFMSVFAITQIPLAISEGILTVVVFNFIQQYSKSELEELNVIIKSE